MQYFAARLAPCALFAVVLFASACVPPPVDPAEDPYGLRANLVDAGIELSWTDPGSAPLGYSVEILPAGGNWSVLGTTAGTTFLDDTIAERTSRKYRIRSIPGPGADWGPYSNVVRGYFVNPVLPVVRVDTEDGAPVVSKDDYLDAHLEIDPNGSGYDSFSGSTEIKGRGNTTWVLPKKPYKLKLDSKASLFGKPAEKDWVLLANYSDRSQLRTWAAQTIGHLTEMAWTPDSVHVELVLNGEYVGVYQLTEQVEIKSARLDITEMEPEDLTGEAVTGGYLLEVDERLEQNQEPGFRTTRNRPVVIKEPEPAEPAQFAYIRDYIQRFENALYGPEASDPVTGYRAYADVDSIIDWYIVQELLKNQDANFSSAYMYKDRSDKLHFGPLWDFDLSMGTTRGIVPTDPEQWWVQQPNKPWTNQFFMDPTFVTRLHQRWEAYRSALDGIPEQLLALGAGLQAPIANDASRWDYEVGTNDTPQYLADWLATRIAWFDAELDALDAT